MTTETKQYITTKEACQQRIDQLNNVCPGCGGPLIPFETVDNSDRPTYWAGCEKCSCYSDGVRPRIFKIAEAMVKNHHHRAYGHMELPHDVTDAAKEYYYQSQIRGTCGQVHLVLKLNKDFENERN